MKIAVLVSGGVDSSVALRLLQEQGHSLTAFYLKIWLEDELSFLGECPWEDDLQYVRRVCEQAAVPLEIVSLQKEYHEKVVAHTIAQVRLGHTPNPDILCNTVIKFGLFIDYIDRHYAHRFAKIASGHYAQLIEKNGMYMLQRAPDPIKDQTYFLAALTQMQLSRALFPIGHLTKKEVRDLAHRYDLPNKDRKDSQGICFLGKLKFSEFINHYLGERPGDLVEFESGIVQGRHKGFWYHTIGQRQGLGLAGGPWYVVSKDPTNNVVFISRNYFSDDKPRNSFIVSSCHWLSGVWPASNTVQVKMRHGSQIYEATLESLAQLQARVILASRDQGIAPGQFAVFYDNDICLGSAVIAATPGD